MTGGVYTTGDQTIGGTKTFSNIIAGGISGAYLGIRALPPEWIARLEKTEYLADVAQRLAAVRRRS